MWLRKINLIGILLIFIFNGVICLSFKKAPIIIPMDQVIVDVNGKQEIECKAEKPIFWISEDNENKLEIKNSILEDDEFKYRAILNLTEVTIKNLGNYFCIFNESHKNNPRDSLDERISKNEATSIYVFINDTENPLFKPKETSILANQFEPFVIPCKPSMPHIKVELLNDNEEILNTSNYDAKIGYIVSFSEVEDSGNYECRVIDSEDTHEISFGITINHQALSDYLPQPEILSDSNFFAKNGTNFTLTCKVKVTTQYPIQIVFELPNRITATKSDNIFVSELIYGKNNQKAQKNLKIIDAKKERDEGAYKCKIIDIFNNSNEAQANISFVESGFINFEPVNDIVEVVEGEKATKFVVSYVDYPKADFTISNPNSEIIFRGDVINKIKYDVKIKNQKLILSINNPTLDDFGNFNLMAMVDGTEFTKTLSLIVKSQPKCKVNDVYALEGDKTEFVCKCRSYPAPIITWSFIACRELSLWPDCKTNSTHEREPEFQPIVLFNTLSFTNYEATFNLNATYPGIIKCHAINSLGPANAQGLFEIGDLTENFTINVQKESKILEGNIVKMECGVTVYNFTDQIDWYKEDELIVEDTFVKIQEKKTKYSFRKLLTFENVSLNERGVYWCKVLDKSGQIHEKNVTIEIFETLIPVITPNFNESEINSYVNGKLELQCNVTGLPKPTLIWYKDGVEFEIEKMTAGRITLSEYNNTLKFESFNEEDSGSYECEAVNQAGVDSKSVNIEIYGSERPINQGLVIIIVFLIIFLVLLISLFSFYLARLAKGDKYRILLLKSDELENFEKGNIESINQDLPMDEQADLLPYDKQYEFPRENLKLGKKIGAGAFGVVVEAIAKNIVNIEEETKVAVKMVKRQADNEALWALVSELKILIYLGQHLNVVNLLGAVTKNIAKRELLVIVEFCRFGNLQTFLAKNRANFIDQVKDGQIDCSIGMDENLRDSGVDGSMKSSNNFQQLNDHLVTTSDLVSWSFQVALGMDYLVKRRVLHGDLAARNILLSDDNIVKICDFGLARNLYKSNTYKKQGQAHLPIKWLSIEAIFDHIFSTYSDVWAFGVTLWEFFSLAQVPYPDMEANKEFFHKLKNGYRMEKPEYATHELYDIMLSCWNFKPDTRPSFRDLAEKFSTFLPERLKNHYIDLNQPYLLANMSNYKICGMNYITSLPVPEEIAPWSPELQAKNKSYLAMNLQSGKVMFQPRTTEGLVIDPILQENQHCVDVKIKKTSF